MSEFGECLATLFDPEDDADCPPLTDAAVAQAENLLGYTLPKTYLQLLAIRNGGYLKRIIVPTRERTILAEDHVLLIRFSESAVTKESTLKREVNI